MADHEGSYNGLDFGAGTDYRLKSLRWWRRATSVNTPDLPRYHGGLVGASYEVSREIEASFLVMGSSESDLVDKLDTLFAAFEPQVEEELPFVWTAPGQTARRIICRPVEDGMSDLEAEDWARGVKEVPFRLTASDPVIYDDDEESVQAAVFVAPGGISYPVSYPTPYGAGGSGGGVNLMLSGSWESWPVFEISGQTGTLTNPIIEQVTQGTRLAMNAHGGITMSSGQVLRVDTHPARRSIAFSTGASRYGRLSDDSVWAPFQPGANQVRFRASGTTDNAVLTVTARSARI